MRRDAEGVNELQALLSRMALRLAIASANRVLARSAVIGAAGLWLLALVALVFPVPLRWGVLGAILAAGLAVAFPVLLWRLRPPVRIAARVADRRLDLADRLGTAVDLLGRSEPPAGLARLQVSDAVEYARAVTPRAAAPLRIPRDAWIAAAAGASLVLWAQFFAGLTLPVTPAARMATIIHREGSRLIDLGRKLDEAGRARGLPEARRIAPQLTDLGRKLTAPRVTREGAVGLLHQAADRLGAARDAVDRRQAALSPDRSEVRDGRTPVSPENAAQRLERLEAAMREIEAVSGRLRTGGSDRSATLAQRLRALSESLDRSGDAPVASRRDVAASRRDVEQGRLSAAAEALGEALRELQATERMLGDAQILSEAQREVQRSSERIAAGEGPGERAPGDSGQGFTEAPLSPEPGPAAAVPGQDAGAPPPPGPNQGSLPGEGRGGAAGAPTPRLQGSHVPTHLVGIPGEGGAAIQEITAPGQVGPSHLSPRHSPAQVAHDVDRAQSREPLPPAYLDIIRRYFEILGGAP